jgi:hypothetical protein
MIRHSASTVNRSSYPPGNTKNGTRPGGWLLLFTVLAEWRIMTNRAYAKSNGDGLLCSILCCVENALWHPAKVGFRNVRLGFRILFRVRDSFRVRVSFIFRVRVSFRLITRLETNLLEIVLGATYFCWMSKYAFHSVSMCSRFFKFFLLIYIKAMIFLVFNLEANNVLLISVIKYRHF